MTVNTQASNTFHPEIVGDLIKAGFSGMTALAGTGAAILNPTLYSAEGQRAGESVKVPYFASIGEYETIATDGDAATEASMSDSVETATVVHLAKAFGNTHLGEYTATLSKNEAARDAIMRGMMRAIDKQLLTAAEDATSWSSYTHDISAATKKTWELKTLPDAMEKLGDEAGDWAALAVHSKIFRDLLNLADSSGRPLLTMPTDGGLPRFFGVPVIQSDRLDVTGGTYTSLLLKRNSLICWFDGAHAANLQEERDALKDKTIYASHLYAVTHRYKHMDGGTKPGVVRILTKAVS